MKGACVPWAEVVGGCVTRAWGQGHGRVAPTARGRGAQPAPASAPRRRGGRARAVLLGPSWALCWTPFPNCLCPCLCLVSTSALATGLISLSVSACVSGAICAGRPHSALKITLDLHAAFKIMSELHSALKIMFELHTALKIMFELHSAFKIMFELQNTCSNILYCKESQGCAFPKMFEHRK